MAEVWVDVPEAAQGLAVIGFRPNPAPTGASVYSRCRIPLRRGLEVLDVAGRRVFSREVGGLGAGQHLVRVDRATPPGVYVLRLTQSGRAVTAKATLTH